MLVLADKGASDSVAALRAGADDVLTRPCDLEELLLRLYRLLAHRTAVLQVLQGDLANHPLWALLQYLRQVRKSGMLRVKAAGGTGTLELRDGEATGARFEGLRGREAMLALLSLEEGGFRFDPEALPESADGELPLHELLMQSAWLKDEIAKRRHLVPPTGQPLQALTPALPALEQDFRVLPVRRVFERILQETGIRLFDLIADAAEAPLSTRLAVALLVEAGAVAPQTGEEEADIQNTREISTVLLLEIAVEDLIDTAAKAGLSATALSYLLLVEPEVWPALRRLVEEGPGFRRNEGLRRLVEQVELRKAGSVTFPARRGKLSLHVQVLNGAAQPQINAIVPGCAGVLVWIRGTGRHGRRGRRGAAPGDERPRGRPAACWWPAARQRSARRSPSPAAPPAGARRPTSPRASSACSASSILRTPGRRDAVADRPTVLLVDPQAERLRDLGQRLAAEGYEVVPVADAGRARRFAEGLGPAVIVVTRRGAGRRTASGAADALLDAGRRGPALARGDGRALRAGRGASPRRPSFLPVAGLETAGGGPPAPPRAARAGAGPRARRAPRLAGGRPGADAAHRAAARARRGADLAAGSTCAAARSSSMAARWWPRPPGRCAGSRPSAASAACTRGRCASCPATSRRGGRSRRSSMPWCSPPSRTRSASSPIRGSTWRWRSAPPSSPPRSPRSSSAS